MMCNHKENEMVERVRPPGLWREMNDVELELEQVAKQLFPIPSSHAKRAFCNKHTLLLF